MNKVYKIVTQKIIDKLNERVIPWKKPWIDLRDYVTKVDYILNKKEANTK